MIHVREPKIKVGEIRQGFLIDETYTLYDTIPTSHYEWVKANRTYVCYEKIIIVVGQPTVDYMNQAMIPVFVDGMFGWILARATKKPRKRTCKKR
jgi:hypothetical protein